MVLKVSKHGVRTGNSIKCRKYTGHYKQYSKQGLIVRNLVHGDEVIDKENGIVLGDIDVRSDSIPYSINKKGRWELPNILKSCIEDGDFDDKDFAVQLLEHHKLIDKNSCISIHTSKSPKSWKENQTSRENKNGYLNSDSLLAPRFYNLSRRERRRRWNRDVLHPDAGEPEEPVVNQSSVQYQVLYPPSPTSCLSYTPRRTGYVSEYSERNDGIGYYHRFKNKCTRRPAYGKEFQREMMDQMLYENEYDPENESLASNSDVDGHDTSRMSREQNTCSLEDMICKPKEKKPRQRKRRYSSSTKSDTSDAHSNNSHIVYEHLESDTSTQTAGVAATTSTETYSQQHVIVSMPNLDTNSQSLKQKYGDTYTECACYPRKFIIDISDKLNEICVSKERETITCVAFSLDIDNEMNNEKDSVYKVTLNSSTFKYTGQCKIETLFDGMETSVEECLRRTVFYLETLPCMANPAEEPPTFHRHKKQRSSNIERYANWESDSYVPNPMMHYARFMESSKSHTDETMPDSSSHVACIRTDVKTARPGVDGDRVCDICYELLGGQVPGTALTSCGHWFCDGCWAEYLQSRVNAGTMATITCPEFDCGKVVDPATVVTLLCLRDVIRHAKCRHDNEIESGKDTKWCPNVKCGRVLKVKSSLTKVANCVCGEMFCFHCDRQPHWPAPCDVFANYYKRLEATGDIGLVSVEAIERVIVNGKNCPHCSKFLEKNGGCPYMSCVCGRSFCWGCGKDWDSNTHQSSCYTQGYKNDHHTFDVTIEDNRLHRNNKKAKWYNVAVKHRAEQHGFKMEKMKLARKKLVPRLSGVIGKRVRKGIPISLEFEGRRSTYRNEQEKLPEYLDEMIYLHQELRQLLENTAVLLDSQQLAPNETPPLMYLTNRMASFAEGISKAFVLENCLTPEDVLNLFKKIRFHSYRAIKRLIVVVNKLNL